MTVLQSIIMGVIQGLTEFLPVSSSGHLVLTRHLLGADLPADIGFEVAVHVGTLLAVVIFFRHRLIKIFGDALSGKREGYRWLGYIVIGTIPAGVVGILLKDQIETLFTSLFLVGVAWIFTATFLLLGERFGKSRVSVPEMGYGRAFFIGLAQAVAIIPGVSRSGSTIAASLVCGVEKKSAVDFVFILSLPAVGGAALLTVKDWLEGSIPFGIEHITGGLAAGLSGYWAIVVLLKVVAGGKLHWFALYCLLLGIVALIMGA